MIMDARLEALGLRGREFDEQAQAATEAEHEARKPALDLLQKSRDESDAVKKWNTEYRGPLIHARGLLNFQQPQAAIQDCQGRETLVNVLPLITVIPPRHHRLRDWLAGWPLAPMARTKLAAAWWVRLPFRAASMLAVVFSGNVDPIRLRDLPRFWRRPRPNRNNRQQACGTCPHRILDVWPGQTFPDLKAEMRSSYCRLCQCPKHPRSTLQYKTRKRKWSCPDRRYNEAYRDDAVRLTLKGLDYVPANHLDAHVAGCGGCGGGATTNGQARRMDEAAVAELNGVGAGG